jgi:hypothetical protein
MTRDDLVEQLAAIEHERWADWQKYLHSKCWKTDRDILPVDGLPPIPRGIHIIPPESLAHWERQIATPYADLSEQEKQSDREQVARYWPLIVDFVPQWLAEQSTPYGPDPDDVARLIQNWREEMGVTP